PCSRWRRRRLLVPMPSRFPLAEHWYDEGRGSKLNAAVSHCRADVAHLVGAFRGEGPPALGAPDFHLVDLADDDGVPLDAGVPAQIGRHQDASGFVQGALVRTAD